MATKELAVTDAPMSIAELEGRRTDTLTTYVIKGKTAEADLARAYVSIALIIRDKRWVDTHESLADYCAKRLDMSTDAVYRWAKAGRALIAKYGDEPAPEELAEADKVIPKGTVSGHKPAGQRGSQRATDPEPPPPILDVDVVEDDALPDVDPAAPSSSPPASTDRKEATSTDPSVAVGKPGADTTAGGDVDLQSGASDGHADSPGATGKGQPEVATGLTAPDGEAVIEPPTVKGALDHLADHLADMDPAESAREATKLTYLDVLGWMQRFKAVGEPIHAPNARQPESNGKAPAKRAKTVTTAGDAVAAAPARPLERAAVTSFPKPGPKVKR